MQYQSSAHFAQQSGPVSVAHSETTRYLCAAAHVDEKFRDYVLHTVVEEEHKAIGELYGVDIIPIVQWTFAARQRVHYRDIGLCLLLIIMLIISIRLLGSSAYYDYNTNYTYYNDALLWNYLVYVPAGLILVSLISIIPSAILAVIILLYSVYSFLILHSFSSSTLLFELGAWLIVILEAGICYYGPRAKSLMRNRFRSYKQDVPLNEALEQKLRAINATQDGNVIIYSGFSPFVGAGSTIGGWSFTVDLSKGKQHMGTGLTPVTFQVGELYYRVNEAIKQLGLHNLVLEDKLFVNGQEIRDNKSLLPDPLAHPYNRAHPSIIQQFMNNPSQDTRYYQCIRVTSWKGELVLSIFLRFIIIGENLFIEADYLLLPPLKEEYYRVDTVSPILTLRKFGKLALDSFVAAPGLLSRAPARVLSAMLHDWFLQRRHRRIQREIRENPAFDYGADSSLREFASSRGYRRHFQLLDKEMYVKVIESQMLKYIISFLDAKNIDTSELRERQEAIINNGIIVSGGSFQAENVAVGERARAAFSNVVGAVRGAVQGNAGEGKQASTSSGHQA